MPVTAVEVWFKGCPISSGLAWPVQTGRCRVNRITGKCGNSNLTNKEAANTPGEMEALTLLLLLFTVSGYSFVLQPRAAVRQIAELERETLPEVKNEQLKDVSLSVGEEQETGHYSKGRTPEEEHKNEGLTPEKMEEFMSGLTRREGDVLKGYEDRVTPGTFAKILENGKKRDTEKGLDEDTREVELTEELEVNEESVVVKETQTDYTEVQRKGKKHKTHSSQKNENDQQSLQKQQKSEQKYEVRHEIEEEESGLVAGISIHLENKGDTHDGAGKVEENLEDERGNEEREKRERDSKADNESEEKGMEDNIEIYNLSPPSTQLEELATIQTQYNHHILPLLLVEPTQDSLTPHHPPTPHAKFSPQFLLPSATFHDPTINHISVTTVAPGEVKSPVGDLTEVLQSPGHQDKQNEPDENANSSLEVVRFKNILFKPQEKETTREIHTVVPPEKFEFIPKVQTAKRNPTKVKFTSKDSKTKGSNSELEHKPNTDKVDTGQLLENDTKRTKAASAQPQLNKTSAETQPTTAKSPSMWPTKNNRNRKNQTKTKKSKGKKRKKDNKTKKVPGKKEVTTPTHFPYFLDDYCPPECACYGRVVQCSDKGVDKVPYGIPYNSRYILLMNNQIDSIQLDLLNEYVSMEFLVLSNNRLTDGAIEGAFEGIPALKRLYLDRNRLESVPTDLPVSLEELRLDNNRLSVMSEAAWARCPGLLVLSLSNNSLGNGSDSLSDGVLSPLSSLHTLNLDHNQLTSVPLGLPLSIKDLYLKGNLIEQFQGGAFKGISEMVVLDLSRNRLTNKGLLRECLVNATHLESLNLEGNKLKQVPRYLPHSLKTLNLEGNLIYSIKKAAVSILKNLEHLGLARNKIIKVAPGAFKALLVLHQLDLCHNTLHQVPRQLPQALHSVALAHNKIRSIPRDAFCWGDKSPSLSRLVRVQLEHNLIEMGKLDVQAFRCLRGFQVVHFY